MVLAIVLGVAFSSPRTISTSEYATRLGESVREFEGRSATRTLSQMTPMQFYTLTNAEKASLLSFYRRMEAAAAPWIDITAPAELSDFHARWRNAMVTVNEFASSMQRMFDGGSASLPPGAVDLSTRVGLQLQSIWPEARRVAGMVDAVVSGTQENPSTTTSSMTTVPTSLPSTTTLVTTAMTIAQTEATFPGATSHYEDPKYGFSFEYPDSYVMVFEKGQPGTVPLSLARVFEAGPAIRVSVHNLKALEARREKYPGGLPSKAGGRPVGYTKELAVGEYPAARVTWEELDQVITEMLVIGDKFLFQVSCSSDIAASEASKPLVEAFLASFQVREPAPEVAQPGAFTAAEIEYLKRSIDSGRHCDLHAVPVRYRHRG